MDITTKHLERKYNDFAQIVTIAWKIAKQTLSIAAVAKTTSFSSLP